MTLTFYGALRGESSFKQVLRGMEVAAGAAGALARVVATDGAGEAEWMPRPSRVAVAVGRQRGLELAHRLGSHEEHWLLLAPNGDCLPGGAVGYLTEGSSALPRGFLSGGFLAPSRWAVDVILAELDRAKVSRPVVYCPHGVDPDVYYPTNGLSTGLDDQFAEGRFRVLHLTSTETERKGTKELLQAWKRLLAQKRIPELSELIVFMNPIHLNRVRWWMAELDLTETQVKLVPGVGFEPRAMANWYRSVHLLCQPSRGEGFGLTPLEALACGTPVVATPVTGHSEYLLRGTDGYAGEGAVLVDTAPSAPMNDFPGSRAPVVLPEAIAAAIAAAYADWTRLSRQAREHGLAVGTDWAWSARAARGIATFLGKE